MKADNTFPGHFIIINGIRTNKEIAMPILQLLSKGKTDGGGLNIVHLEVIILMNCVRQWREGHGGFIVRWDTWR